jgi:hypothetical protein
MMATADLLRRLALALPGTSEAAHFDRAAFKAGRIYVTLASDGMTANFRFDPTDQELKCTMAPDLFTPLPNAWGRQGWTVARLADMSEQDLQNALQSAWRHAQPIRRKRAARS